MNTARILSSLTIAFILISNHPALAGEWHIDCYWAIQNFGFSHRARSKCDTDVSLDDAKDLARVCAQVYDEDETKRIIESGVLKFDQMELDQGHSAACQNALHNYFKEKDFGFR